MGGKIRIALGVLLVAAALGLVVLALAGGGKRSGAGRGAAAPGALTSAASAAAENLSSAVEGLRDRAKTAAGVQPLRSALADRVDVPTVVDLFATEEWWRPYRDEMVASRVIVGDAVAHHGSLDLGVSDRDVVIAARKVGSAAEVAAVGGRAVVLGAARMDVGVRGEPVVVLARPLDSRILQEVAERNDLGLMITDGKSSLAMGAPEQHRGFLRSLARSAESQASDPEGTLVAARVPLSRTAQLWAVRPGPPAAKGGSGDGTALFGGAAALVVAGLALLLTGKRRRGTAVTSSDDFPEEHTLPFGTSQQRPRVASTGARVAGGSRSGQRAAAVARVSQSAQLPRALMRTPGAAQAPALQPDIPNTTPEPMPAVVMAAVHGADSSKLFGRYKVIERLGVGGMSEVYTAVAHGAEGFSRTFVIKRLRQELAHNKDAVAQFIDEARVQASLVHSNIVPVFDFGMMGGEYFMIEEYVLGRDLARVSTRCVERTGFRLEPRLAYYFIYETLQALGYAHAKRGRDGEPLGIVHRDVSATNIMVSSSGEVKLFDFGIAKANQRTTQTQAGMVKGNANFMSPEQARGQNVDQRSDLYSLGLVMYFCMTNQLLYTGDNDLDILYRAACGPTAEDLERIRQLPPEAAIIMEKVMAIDPADRYQNAEEFAAALAPHAGGMKVEASSLMELLFGDELRQEAA
jgi:hypothetical protein